MRRTWKMGLLALLAVALLVAGYIVYVFMTYYRLKDNLPLTVTCTVKESELGTLATGTMQRVVSYNIGFGAYSHDYSFFMDGGKESRARSEQAVYENVRGAVSAIRNAEPDFVLVQEVDQHGDRSFHVDQRPEVEKALDGSWVFAQNFDSPYLFWPLLKPHGANKAGQMTLTRYPITSALRRSLPIDPGVMKLVDLDRCYSVSRIPVQGGKELALYNVHLSAYTADGTIANNQLKMLFADMVDEVAAGNYAIAGGDFNKDLLGNSPELFGRGAVEGNWALPIPEKLIPDGLELVAPLDPENPVPSCRNADQPYGPDDLVLTIDGFVVSRNVRVLESQVLDEGFRWSDHNPVYMDFVLET